MTYVKLVTLAVFMLTTFLIVQTKNVEAGKCPSAEIMERETAEREIGERGQTSPV
ncbi:hypothetical protein MtrunA17_Chr3g0092771 [Medicago truncatula]|uniref:Uncharacterized protein n=1 Tax=Medicago truncatula TaxID=3880 RepID=A0A396ILM2_MEDTR|nr:hypothetical protein MtrunA17_Chr3g0092771 [Medicago truncatula]